MTITFLELYRRRTGLTTRELAKKAGYVANLFSQIEHGHKNSWPSFRNRVSYVLGVSEGDLFDEHGKPLIVEIDFLLSTVKYIKGDNE